MNKIRIFFVSVLFINFFAVSNICGQNSKKQVLNNSELRLQAIYDRNEFRAKRLRANWLPDGSGYTVLEPNNESQKQVLVRYEMANGNRTVIDSSLKEENLKLENISPDGKRILYYEQGNLHVRDVRLWRDRFQWTGLCPQYNFPSDRVVVFVNGTFSGLDGQPYA